MERATKLIETATGEPYGDGYTVTDVGEGISEPGYSNGETNVWVMGDWNPKRFRRDGDPKLTNEESLPERLGNALEKYAEADLLWSDEWIRCENCYQAFRTEPDSYGWTMFGLYDENGMLCGECVSFDDVEHYINDPDRAITLDIDLESEGFVKYNREYYENGFHPGQDDKPKDALQSAHDAGWDEGIFKITGVGQFDMRFDLYVRKEA